ncbi:TerB family tellurite resistance protein [Thalassotalea euphylliae]|uniref:tellurite resistance TerB family protein n=1 Tax=Thalassotalea euphylliae TaxID=1655234 RepID=UPI00363F11F4
MISKIKAFFQQFEQADQVPEAELTIDMAVSVLLVEVMKADGMITDDEQQTMATLLMSAFSLTPLEVDDIMEHAIALSENATDFYRFTSILNQQYSPEQKIEMVSLLWQLAKADGEVAAIEQHVIRKIGDLLHLRQAEYIKAKDLALQ